MIDEYDEIRKLLSKAKRVNDPVFMFIEIDYDEMDSMPIDVGNGFTWSSSMFKQEVMEAGKRSKQEQYYLITDRMDRDVVYLALEKAISTFDIKGLANESIICSKISNEMINTTRSTLLEKGYYNRHLYLLPDSLFKNLLDM